MADNEREKMADEIGFDFIDVDLLRMRKELSEMHEKSSIDVRKFIEE